MGQGVSLWEGHPISKEHSVSFSAQKGQDPQGNLECFGPSLLCVEEVRSLRSSLCNFLAPVQWNQPESCKAQTLIWEWGWTTMRF